MTKKFVIFVEGADGVGKSTTVRLLTDKFIELGFSAQHTCIMRRTIAGAAIRQNAINYEQSDELRFVGFCYGVFNTLERLMKPNEIIIVDRSQASTFAQSICASNCDAETKKAMLHIFNKLDRDFRNRFKNQYLHVYLELNPEVAMKRIEERGEQDLLEQRGLKYQEDIIHGYKTYYDLYETDNVVKVNLDGLANTQTDNREEITNEVFLKIKSSVPHLFSHVPEQPA